MTSPIDTRYDVAILGAGIAGSTLATILARHDLRVLLLDAGVHPRFVVGESTIPHATTTMRILAERYDVPELRALATFEGTAEQVARTCGRKQNFGFVYHEQGEPSDPGKANQVVLSSGYRGAEAHWFRQDIDAYVFHLAVRYGATARSNTRVTDIAIDTGRGVELGTAAGETFTAEYLVDATGFRSVLAERFGLREQPTRARTRSRSLFTHMIGVQPFDDVAPVAYDPPTRWHNGTLHHVFDGGWLWVIPFDNNDRSLNPLCSVGLTLTGDAVDDDRPAPEQEFRAFLDRFPAVARQFRDAAAVRPWGEHRAAAVLRDRHRRRALLPHRPIRGRDRRPVLPRAGELLPDRERPGLADHRGRARQGLVDRALRRARRGATAHVRRPRRSRVLLLRRLPRLPVVGRDLPGLAHLQLLFRRRPGTRTVPLRHQPRGSGVPHPGAGRFRPGHHRARPAERRPRNLPGGRARRAAPRRRRGGDHRDHQPGTVLPRLPAARQSRDEVRRRRPGHRDGVPAMVTHRRPAVDHRSLRLTARR
ncbi:tryptophan 7-halogenase [Nocardia farcinica]|nr:tryptophan 7-halogenase [Nocardia farcinica]